jgi:antitoxin component YwqK of YwqJK toxin-antitoxin module
MKRLLLLSIIFLTACATPSPEEKKNEVFQVQLYLSSDRLYEFNSETPFTGIARDTYLTGQLREKAFYKDGKPEGLTEMYFKDGKLWQTHNWKDGKREGLQLIYHQNGNLRDKGYYVNDKIEGIEETYRENGELSYKVCYRNGEEVNMSYCEK